MYPFAALQQPETPVRRGLREFEKQVSALAIE
jgi:hypothetical protein